MIESKYLKGKQGEDIAAKLLLENGYFIAARNYRSDIGEIDIIAENRRHVLFVEVKLRSSSAGYMPREAVTADKRRRLVYTAKNYIYKSHNNLPPRFDIIEIIQNKNGRLKDTEVNWIKNAFGVSSDDFL